MRAIAIMSFFFMLALPLAQAQSSDLHFEAKTQVLDQLIGSLPGLQVEVKKEIYPAQQVFSKIENAFTKVVPPFRLDCFEVGQKRLDCRQDIVSPKGMLSFSFEIDQSEKMQPRVIRSSLRADYYDYYSNATGCYAISGVRISCPH